MSEILYVGLKLTEESRAEILSRGNWEELHSEGKRVTCDHMTAEFRPSEDSEILSWVKENLGKIYKLNVVRFGYDVNEFGTVHALEVETEAPSRNEHKHITIMVTGKRKPVESNDIKNWEPIKPFELEAEPYIWTKK